jgi:hypothetical protein
MRRGWVNGLFSGFILLVVVILGTRASIAGLEIVTGGVRIMNPLRTRYFRWEEIRMFRFYEPQVGPAYVRIELSNGAHYHVFGLMGGFQPEWGEEVRQAAEALNEELANHTP